MSMSVGDRASSLISFPFAADPGLDRAREGFGAARLLKAACTPMNLAVCAVVALGWFALIGWTGAGPDGWQARLCADLDLRPRACSAVRLGGGADRTAMNSVGTSS
ncbi:MAG: hypothetical protein PGN25_06850 [Methylorubrum populi]